MKFSSEQIKAGAVFVILAFQHVFAMMGSNILVPMVSGLPISNSLFSAGTATVLFHFITKRKVPVFLGSSFAFLSSLALFEGSRPERMGRIFVGTLSTSIVYYIFAAIFYFVGADRIKKLFPPLVIGPIIMVIGLTLAPSVIKSNIADQYMGENPAMSAAAAWVTALLTTVTIIVVNLFGFKFMKTIPILLGIIVGYISGACFGIVDTQVIVDSPWILFQPDSFLDSFSFYKHIAFDVRSIVNFAPLAIVTLMEHFGDITTNGAIVGTNFFEDPGIHRTVFGDGVALTTAALLGGPPITTYGENTGVLAITRQYNPKLLLAAGIIAICLGVITKFGAVIAAIPSPVIGGAAIVLFGMITTMGIKVLVDARVHLEFARNMLVVSLILVIGLGFTFGIAIEGISISPLAIATIVGIITNLILPYPPELKEIMEEEEQAKASASVEESLDSAEKNNENEEAQASESDNENGARAEL